MTNSQKSSFNNEKNDKIPNSPDHPRLGKVDEVTQENLNNDEEKKTQLMPPGQKKNSSKNFDIKDFEIENAEKLFDNEAPMVPRHLTQIPFLIVKKFNYFCIKNEKNRKNK